jgi:hypothetical protein
VSSIWPADAHKAWLKSLKVGDVVCVYCDTRGGPQGERYTKSTVERITPTGAFRIREKGSDGIDKFSPDGTARHGGSWGWTEYMRPWTEEIDKLLARRKLVNSVLFYLDRSVVDRELVEALSDDDLKRLVMALRPFRKKALDTQPQ